MDSDTDSLMVDAPRNRLRGMRLGPDSDIYCSIDKIYPLQPFLEQIAEFRIRPEKLDGTFSNLRHAYIHTG